MRDGALLTTPMGGAGIWAMFCPPSAHLNRLQVDLEQVQNHLHRRALGKLAHICGIPAG